MEDPDLIATLIPVNGRSRQAFASKENKSRCLPPIKLPVPRPAISGRASTPTRDLSYDDSPSYGEDTHRLQLTFQSRPPKDPSKGYVFGTDKKKCDIILGPRGYQDISQVHCSITFETIQDRKRLVLRDNSTNGCAVGYNGRAQREIRDHFRWILDLKLGGEGGHPLTEVNVRDLKFRVQLASHHTCASEYETNVDEFLKLSVTSEPVLGGLNIDSYTTEVAPSQSRTPSQRPIYLRDRTIGKGAFGVVDRVVDVSTGMIYARKTFNRPQESPDPEFERRQTDAWLNKVRREIRIMRENSHELIAPIFDFHEGSYPFFNFQEGSSPFLVMPFLPLGSLRYQASQLRLTRGEAMDVLLQGLDVLVHLHSRGVTYRDLKSDNILVKSRSPLRVLFTDFGLSKDQPNLETFCGTPGYAAPELYDLELNYTPMVDIWALGVVILKCLYGVPSVDPMTLRSKQLSLEYCQKLVDRARTLASDPLIRLLTIGMLRMDAQERLSATDCLTIARDLGLVGKPPANPGDCTPTSPKLSANVIGKQRETRPNAPGARGDARRGFDNLGPLSPSGSTPRDTTSKRQQSALSNLSDHRRPKRQQGPRA